jgi:hypothetical protein
MALRYQDGTGHQRTAPDAVFTVQKSPPAVADVLEHPIHTLVQLIVCEAMTIRRGDVQEGDAGLVQRIRVVARLFAAVNHGRDTTPRKMLDLACSERTTHNWGVTSE